MLKSGHFLLIASIFYIALFSLYGIETAHSFISREYTIQEVLDACSNVAFGEVKSVDQKRKRAIVRLEEDLKGKSEFSEIKINVAVGQRLRESTPEMLMKKFQTGLPAIIFYQREGNKLNGLGYVSGTWFQIFGDNKKDKNKVWWGFTHIEIHMHRTFTGTTEEFQDVLRAMLSGEKWPRAQEGDIKVLVLTGNGVKPVKTAETGAYASATAEFLEIKKATRYEDRGIAYEQTKDRNLPDLDEAHILWIGVDELGLDGYQIGKSTENKIKNFVKNGGVAIVSSQDSDTDKLCGNGWIPEPIKGVDIQLQQDFKTTKQAGDIFRTPSVIKSGSVRLDDTWTEWNSKYKIMATTNDGKNIVLASLQYGRGMYLITALQNETVEYAKANSPLMGNIIHFSAGEVAKKMPPKPQKVKALVLTGNGTKPIQNDPTATAEFLTLQKFSKVGKWGVTYRGIKDKNLPGLDDADILWVGLDEIGLDGYRIDRSTENKIKNFVKNGGVVIVSSQDSDTDRPYGNAWLPEPIKGVEESTRSDFKPTDQAGDIFKKPKTVKPGSVNLDDTWTGWSGKYRILATTNGGKNIALAMLQYGRGMYVITALLNESEKNVRTNAPLMENIMHFSVKWLKSHSG